MTLLPNTETELNKKMRRYQVFEKDLVEHFVLSSGPGGQNVNKVATCVVLKHSPSGIQVKCQSGRSQKQNRFLARELLIKKIENKLKEQKLKEQQAKEKQKRQTRPRPPKLKEKILEFKHKKSEKKQFRQKVRLERAHDI